MTLTPAQLALQCGPCEANGRRGYCAPGRCYCAHLECPAAESYQPRQDPFDNVTEISKGGITDGPDPDREAHLLG